jgi:hypothetical protein
MIITIASGSRIRCQALKIVRPPPGLGHVGERLEERLARDLFDRLFAHEE